MNVLSSTQSRQHAEIRAFFNKDFPRAIADQLIAAAHASYDGGASIDEALAHALAEAELDFHVPTELFDQVGSILTGAFGDVSRTLADMLRITDDGTDFLPQAARARSLYSKAAWSRCCTGGSVCAHP